MNDRLSRIRRSANYNGKTFQNLTATPHTLVPGSTQRMLKQQWFGGEQRRPLGALPLAWPGIAAHATPPAGSFEFVAGTRQRGNFERSGVGRAIVARAARWAKPLSPAADSAPPVAHD